MSVGQGFDLWFDDFPPLGDMVVTYEMAGAEPLVYNDAADAFGDSWWIWEAEASGPGQWLVTGEAVETECTATLDVTIRAASEPSPSPTAAPSQVAVPVPTAAVTLPPTSTAAAETSRGPSELPAMILFLIGAATIAVASARLSMRRA